GFSARWRALDRADRLQWRREDQPQLVEEGPNAEYQAAAARSGLNGRSSRAPHVDPTSVPAGLLPDAAAGRSVGGGGDPAAGQRALPQTSAYFANGLADPRPRRDLVR